MFFKKHMTTQNKHEFTVDMNELIDYLTENRVDSAIDFCSKDKDIFSNDYILELIIAKKIPKSIRPIGIHIHTNNIFDNKYDFMYDFRDKYGNSIKPITKEKPLLTCFCNDVDIKNFIIEHWPNIHSATCGMYFGLDYRNKLLEKRFHYCYLLEDNTIMQIKYEHGICTIKYKKLRKDDLFIDFIKRKGHVPTSEEKILNKIHALEQKLDEHIEDLYKPDGIVCEVAKMRFEKRRKEIENNEEDDELKGL